MVYFQLISSGLLLFCNNAGNVEIHCEWRGEEMTVEERKGLKREGGIREKSERNGRMATEEWSRREHRRRGKGKEDRRRER